MWLSVLLYFPIWADIPGAPHTKFPHFRAYILINHRLSQGALRSALSLYRVLLIFRGVVVE